MPAEDELIIGARAIVWGKVTAVEAAYDERRGRVFTYVTLKVRQWLKGGMGGRRIVLKEEGGEAGGHGTLVTGSPRFAPGERVFLYLDTWLDGSFRVHQMALGKYDIVADPTTGALTVVRPAAGKLMGLAHRAAHARLAGDRATSRMGLDDFLSLVRGRLTANHERSEAFHQTWYAAAPMLARPPEYARRRGRGELAPQFQLNPRAQPARWFEPDDNLPVTFHINPDGAPYPQIVEDAAAALAAWSNVPGCRLRVVNGGPTTHCLTPATGVNAIVFNNCDGRFSPTPGCSRVVAFGLLNYSTAQTRTVNGTPFYKATWAGITFNPYSACSFADRCNVREIAAHEVGHTLGLGHSADPEATMFGVAHFDGRCDALRADDADGITFVYPVADGGLRPLEIITDGPLQAGRLNTPYAQVLSAFGGQRPYTWGVVPDHGRVPPGTSFYPDGVIGGTPSQAGTFDFTVEVVDAAHNRVSRAFSITVTAGEVAYDARYVAQTVPATVEAGQSFTVNLKWLNTGAQAWDGATGFQIGAQNPADNTTWGSARVPPPPVTIQAGDLLDLVFTATAPPAAGTYNFQWRLYKDGVGFFGQPSANMMITVTPAAPPPPPPPPPPPVIEGPDTLTLKNGAAVSQPYTATGGKPPYHWSVVAGVLPAGIRLDAASGMLVGSSTVTGGHTATLQVTDAESRFARRDVTITVLAPPPAVALPAPLEALKGLEFRYQLIAVQGTAPFAWALTQGALPPGLSLNPASGLISGTATAPGLYDCVVTLRDQSAETAAAPVQIKVIDPETIPRITQARYKSDTRKLKVSGERFDSSARLLLDGAAVPATLKDGTFTVKRLGLVSGRHEVKVVNGSGLASQPYYFDVR